MTIHLRWSQDIVLVNFNIFISGGGTVGGLWASPLIVKFRSSAPPKLYRVCPSSATYNYMRCLSLNPE